MEGLTTEYYSPNTSKEKFGTAYDQVERDYWNRTYDLTYEKPKSKPFQMTTTLTELKEELKQLPEIDLLEILEISSEDIVDRFEDLIDIKQDQLINELEELENEDLYNNGGGEE